MRALLKKSSSTKAERRFHEILKRLHIPFKAKVKIEGREVDFIIGKYAIDIDGHKQDSTKNTMLITKGYNPIHFSNNSISSHLDEWLTHIYYGSIRNNRCVSGDKYYGSSPNHR